MRLEHCGGSLAPSPHQGRAARPWTCEGPVDPLSPPKTTPRGRRTAPDSRLGLAFSCRRRPGSRSSGQPDGERACAVRLPYDERPGGGGAGGGADECSPRPVAPPRAARPGRGEPLPCCWGVTRSPRPFSLRFLAPRALRAAPPAPLRNCLLEAAAKCREGRFRFTAASPRREPGSAHRRQPRLPEPARRRVSDSAPRRLPRRARSGPRRCDREEAALPPGPGVETGGRCL